RLAGVVPVQGGTGEGLAVLGVHGGQVRWRHAGQPAAGAAAPACRACRAWIGRSILPPRYRPARRKVLFPGALRPECAPCIDAGDQCVGAGLQPLQPPQQTEGTMWMACCGTATPAAARIARTSLVPAQVATRRWPLAGSRSTR